MKKEDLMFVVDIVSKILIPLALFTLSYATYLTNKVQDEKKFKFEQESKTIEFKQKNIEIAQGQINIVSSKENRKSDFIQTHYNEIISRSPGIRNNVDALIKASFDSSDQQDLLARISLVRNSALKYSLENGSDSWLFYKGQGLLLTGRHDYIAAEKYFEAALSVNQDDAELWNFDAYLKFKNNKTDQALKSISEAWERHKTDDRLGHLIVLNATKIICAQGKLEEGAGYLQSAMKAWPALYADAKIDGELINICKLRFS